VPPCPQYVFIFPPLLPSLYLAPKSLRFPSLHRTPPPSNNKDSQSISSGDRPIGPGLTSPRTSSAESQNRHVSPPGGPVSPSCDHPYPPGSFCRISFIDPRLLTRGAASHDLRSKHFQFSRGTVRLRTMFLRPVTIYTLLAFHGIPNAAYPPVLPVHVPLCPLFKEIYGT